MTEMELVLEQTQQGTSHEVSRKPESAKSGTEEDVEAYMEERVDEPSSEEFSMSSIPQGPAPAKIVKWQIIKTGKRGAYQIIREDNTDVVYVNFQGLLNDLTRDDLKELYRLMMLKYGDNRPEEEFERVLWGDLKTMFDPPSKEDPIWKLPHQQQILNWRYFHSCSVHCLTVEAAHIYMLTEVKYPLPPRVCKAMLEKKLLGDRKDEFKDNSKDNAYNILRKLIMKILKETWKFNNVRSTVRGRLLGIIINRLKSGSYRVNSGVTVALAARDANTNGVDSHNSGTGARRNERATREYTYPEFMRCQPLNFKGTEGVVKLTQWIEKMQTVTVGNDIAYAMTWTELKKKIIDKYCPRIEIKKLKVELWELKVKGTDVIGSTTNANHQRGTGSGQKPTCFECGVQGHFKRECPKLKNNNNRGNQVGGGMYQQGDVVRALRGTKTQTQRRGRGTSQIAITPTALDHYYDVELADGRIIRVLSNKVVYGLVVKYHSNHSMCTRDLSYPWGNETLIVHGDGSNRGHEARLHIISYSKTQEYMLKGCPVFLAHVTTKEVEDKSEKKRLEDVPIVQVIP
ncbi:putative reverse transcriptase domain-containing protein [Tanacetum coccineum]